MFGEIMYGGHITDDWDRRLCRTYLLEYLQPELVEGELYLAPGFLAPPSTDYVGYHEYVENYLPTESPVLYGLHPNAEIGKIFRLFLSLKIKLNKSSDFVYPTVYSAYYEDLNTLPKTFIAYRNIRMSALTHLLNFTSVFPSR